MWGFQAGVLRREKKGAQIPERIWFDSIHNMVAASPFFPRISCRHTWKNNTTNRHGSSRERKLNEISMRNFSTQIRPFICCSSLSYFLPDVFCIRFNFQVSTFDACVCHFLCYLFPAADVLHGSCKKVTTTTTKKVDRRSFLLPNNRKTSPATFTRRCRSFSVLKFFLPSSSSLSIFKRNFHQ